MTRATVVCSVTLRLNDSARTMCCGIRLPEVMEEQQRGLQSHSAMSLSQVL